MISERDLVQSISSKWIRTKVDFGLLNSSLLCLREPRTVCRKAAEPEIDVDFFFTLSPNYKRDDNHKANIDILNFFFLNCKLMTAAAYNLQQIIKM